MEFFTCQRSLMAQETGYYHIGSHIGVGRKIGNEGGVGGEGPSRTQMWILIIVTLFEIVNIYKPPHYWCILRNSIILIYALG